MDRMKRRADFLAAATGVRVQATPFLVQARDRRDRDGARVGFTVTKKVGSAVERNRIRRRLRAAARAVLPRLGRAGFDYVLVARRPALSEPFDAITRDLERALARVHAAEKSGRGPARSA
jgi:ribonuclease P protein component